MSAVLRTPVPGWGAPQLRWVGVSSLEWQQNLVDLLKSNPVFSQGINARSIKIYPQVRRWIALKCLLFAQENLAAARDDRDFQALLESKITDLLSKCHYLYVLINSKPTEFFAAEGQFWFPPSYFVCGWKTAGSRPLYMQMRFLGRPFFDEEFYGLGNGSKHPALLINRLSSNSFLMVPFTSKRKGGKGILAVSVRSASAEAATRTALCRLWFRVCERMLGGEDGENLKGLSITSEDFTTVKAEAQRWIDR